MSSLEYRKCSARPGMRCSCASTACELWVGSTDGVGEELLAAHDRHLRVIPQPRRRRRVGGDEDAAHPRRVHVDAAERVAQLVDVAVARGSVVAFADDVLRHLRGALPLELARGAVDPREHQVDVLGELVGLHVEHARDRPPASGRIARRSVKVRSAVGVTRRVSALSCGASTSSSPKRQNSSADGELVSRSASSPSADDPRTVDAERRRAPPRDRPARRPASAARALRFTYSGSREPRAGQRRGRGIRPTSTTSAGMRTSCRISRIGTPGLLRARRATSSRSAMRASSGVVRSWTRCRTPLIQDDVGTLERCGPAAGGGRAMRTASP